MINTTINKSEVRAEQAASKKCQSIKLGLDVHADTIREDIRQKNSTGLLSALANVSALKDIAEELYVDPDQQVDPKRFSSACVRAFMSLPN